MGLSLACNHGGSEETSRKCPNDGCIAHRCWAGRNSWISRLWFCVRWVTGVSQKLISYTLFYRVTAASRSLCWISRSTSSTRILRTAGCTARILSPLWTILVAAILSPLPGHGWYEKEWRHEISIRQYYGVFLVVGCSSGWSTQYCGLVATTKWVEVV